MYFNKRVMVMSKPNMGHKVFLRKMGSEAGEQPGQDAANDKNRKV